jgi:hypothetical protein
VSRMLPLLSLLGVLAISGGASSQVKAPIKAPPKSPAACVSVTASVRSEAYGYTHLVVLRNGCEKPVECQVWTDVDPTPRRTLRAAPGESSEIVTRIGSPASAVTAFKECRFI